MRLVVLPILFLSAAAAPAQPAPQNSPAPHRAACAEFVDRYCKDVPIGQGRRIDCLNKHKAQLNSACRARLAIMQQLFAFGKEQRKKTDAFLAKQAAAEAKKSKPVSGEGGTPK